MLKSNQWNILIALLLFPFVLFGQNRIDSLYRELKSNPASLGLLNDLAAALVDIAPEKADSLAMICLPKARTDKNLTEEVRALMNIVNAAWGKSDFNKVLIYAERTAELYLSTGQKVEAASALNDAALAAYEIDLYDVALWNYRRTLNLLLETDDTENLPSVLVNLGQVHERMGHSDSAIYCYRQAIGLCQGPGFEIELTSAYGNLGLVYRNIGNFDLALENYTKARDISVTIDDKESMATDLNNIASLYVHWENYAMAREYFQLALDIYQNSSRQDKVEVTMSNLALLYQKEGKYDSALALFNTAYAIASKLGRTGSMAVKLSNIGIIYYELGNYDTAIYFQKEALRIGRDLGRMFAVCSALQNLGEIYLAKNDLPASRSNLEEALDCADEIQARTILEKVYKSQSQLFEKMGNTQEAFNAYKKYIAIKDSVFTKQSQDKLAELEAVYQNEKKQQQIQLLLNNKALNEARIRKNHILFYWLSSGLLILLISSAFIFTLFVQKARANRMLVEKNLKLMEQDDYDEMTLGIRNSLTIGDEEKIRLISELNRLIKQEKIFTRKLLTLNELAESLGTNTAYLSRIINVDFQDNFPNFINQLRIQEAQKMFTGNKHKFMTIEGIADSVGFHSRSVFNVYFKKFSGVTPSVFIKNLEKVSQPQT